MKTYLNALALLEQEPLPYKYQFMNEKYKKDTTKPIIIR
jgi:hypothetical protein